MRGTSPQTTGIFEEAIENANRENEGILKKFMRKLHLKKLLHDPRFLIGAGALTVAGGSIVADVGPLRELIENMGLLEDLEFVDLEATLDGNEILINDTISALPKGENVWSLGIETMPELPYFGGSNAFEEAIFVVDRSDTQARLVPIFDYAETLTTDTEMVMLTQHPSEGVVALEVAQEVRMDLANNMFYGASTSGPDAVISLSEIPNIAPGDSVILNGVDSQVNWFALQGNELVPLSDAFDITTDTVLYTAEARPELGGTLITRVAEAATNPFELVGGVLSIRSLPQDSFGIYTLSQDAMDLVMEANSGSEVVPISYFKVGDGGNLIPTTYLELLPGEEFVTISPTRTSFGTNSNSAYISRGVFQRP